MRTLLCDTLDIEIPIIQAPMGGAAGPALAAAVSNAGALGTLALWRLDATALLEEVHTTHRLTTKPFAVNLNLHFPQEERLEACLEASVPIISFFWGHQPALIQRAKDRGAKVLQTVGNAGEARIALQSGADVIVAQGWEAGGHVWGNVATMPLIPAVVDAVSPTPVVAAGGIGDGRGLAAVLALGASGAWIGTRFLAADEAPIHPHYRARLFNATEKDTTYLPNLFDIGWPDAPHRVLRNSTVDRWEDAGYPVGGDRPGENEVIAVSKSRGPIVRYRSITASSDMEGDIEAMPLWAGQSVALVNKAQPAAQILQEIVAEASAVLDGLSKSLT